MNATLSNRLNTLVNAVLVVCAITVTALVVRREVFAPKPLSKRAAGPEMRLISNGRSFGDAGHVLGDSTASMRVVIFSDFQCPFCARVPAVMADLRRRYPTRVAFVYRHFPLSAIHPFAKQAAIGAECADAQGRFEAFHDLVFAKQDSIGIIPWDTFATRAGVSDPKKFAQCLVSQSAAMRLARDQQAGSQLALNSTPSIVIANRLYAGLPPMATLDSLIRDQR